MRLPPLSRCIRGSALAAVLLLTLTATPALAGYYPSGPQTSVEKSKLDGWQLCFTDLYNGEESLNGILTQCDGDPLLLAGGPTGSETLTVLAAAPRTDVIFDTGESNVPHNANGSGWYFSPDFSWGFAKQGDPILRDSCDTLESPNSELRLCWHTDAGLLDGGYRAGAILELNNSVDYTRYIYEGVPGINAFSFAVKGKKLIVSVKTSGTVSVSDAAAPLSASASKKKRRLLLSSSSASGGPPKITVPLRLTKTAKAKLREKGKLAVKARIAFQGVGPAPAQTAKLKIRGKSKKKK